MERGLQIGGAIASILALILAIVLIPGVASWIYPLPLLIVVSLALVASFTGQALVMRRPAAADQRLLDRVLSAVPREAIRRLGYEDFAVAWPADLLYPVQFFFNELGDPEHEFASKSVERARRNLYQAAERLLTEEGSKGIMAPDSSRRWVGIAAGELDLAPPEKRLLYEERQQSIHAAAGAFVAAHDALVRAAKKRGLDLRALDSVIPERSWTGVAPVGRSSIRAHWPGE